MDEKLGQAGLQVAGHGLLDGAVQLSAGLSPVGHLLMHGPGVKARVGQEEVAHDLVIAKPARLLGGQDEQILTLHFAQQGGGVFARAQEAGEQHGGQVAIEAQRDGRETQEALDVGA